jgi:hypothetical protein
LREVAIHPPGIKRVGNSDFYRQSPRANLHKDIRTDHAGSSLYKSCVNLELALGTQHDRLLPAPKINPDLRKPNPALGFDYRLCEEVQRGLNGTITGDARVVREMLLPHLPFLCHQLITAMRTRTRACETSFNVRHMAKPPVPQPERKLNV